MAMAGASPATAQGQGVPVRTPDYFRDAASLARILGECHAVRYTCNGVDDQYWRVRMKDLLDLEAPAAGGFRSSLVNAFNNGFQSARARYPYCDEAAVEAEAAFAADGQVIAERLARHYFPKGPN